MARFDDYVAALDAWREAKNLIGPGTRQDIWRRHIADSLQISALVPSDRPRLWLDLGAGAGLPGLILSIARPQDRFDLVEANGRKCAFMRAVVRSLGLDASIHQKRIEVIVPTLDPVPDIVTARALAPLDQLMVWCAPLWSAGSQAYFSKGKGAEAELTEARRHWNIDASLIASRIDPAAHLIHVRQAAPRQP